MRRLIALVSVLAMTGVGLVARAASTRAEVPGSNGQIVFERPDPTIEGSRAFTINPDGTHEQQLLDTFIDLPRWSPDGTRIAMICCDFALAPTIINADGSGLIQLPIPPGFPIGGCDVWSADGSRLACGFGGFDPPQPERDGIYTLRASDGGDPVQLTVQAGEDGADDYSPDGSQIVFFRIDYSRPEKVQTALFVVNIDGSGLRRLTSWGLGGFTASWSPDGRWILFDSKARIWVVHPDGSDLQKILIDTGGRPYRARDPAWSPDGTLIALSMRILEDGQLRDIYTMRPDGTDLVQVTDSPTGGDERPDWGTHPLAT